MPDHTRPDPESLLKSLKADEAKKSIGRLRIFFGMSAGVGKTYAMLKASQDLLACGDDVVVGVVETHGRKETEALLHGLPVIDRKVLEYRGTQVREMDVDGVLARHPAYAIVDELAHSNAPGSRHPKRYQDVLELLDAGINVYTTLNVQHLDSQNDVVKRITGVDVRETVPDSVLERADQITIVDITPEELLERLRDGKVYLAEQSQRATENFFKEESLTALRELALRVTAEHVETELEEIRQGALITARWNSSERLLVAVSHSPHSESLIRATRRHASAMRAPWIALNVDTGVALSKADADQLSRNLKLAQELGGEVITTADTDVVNAVERLSRQRDITQIVIGRPEKRFWQNLLRGGSILDRLVRRSHDIDIHVIRPLVDIRSELRAPVKEALGPLSKQIGIIVAIVAGLTAVNFFIQDVIGYRAVGFVYLLTIVVLATRSTFWPMFAAATLSALIWNFLFIPPPFTFHISQPEDIMMFAAYFIVASITGYLTLRTSRQDRLLRQREMRTEVLLDFVRTIVETYSIEDLSAEVDRRTQRLFQSRSRIITVKSDGSRLAKPVADNLMSFDESEWAVAVWAHEHGQIAGRSTDTLTQAKCMCIPLVVGEKRLGILMFRPIEEFQLEKEQRDLLMAICHQTAIAIERERLLESTKTVSMLQESERLHQTLLNSISHELRTPLTTIIGSTTALKEGLSKIDEQGQRQLLGDVSDASDRLTHVINNLLNMSRINSGVLQLYREWFVFFDLINESISENTRLIGTRRVIVSSIPESILYEGDYSLLKHALSNLVRNACQYSASDSEIEISVRADAKSISVDVKDRGRGIEERELPRVFEKFYRPDGSPAGGIGLGLSIARSVVELHSGEIMAMNRDGGGMVFSVILPLHTPPPELKENSE